MINAVVVREMRSRMRGWRTAAIITIYLAILAGITAAMLIGDANTQSTLSQSAQAGANMFAGLSLFQLLLLIFITPASAAPAISGERQRQTLDLLLVTKLSSTSIVAGKLVAALSFDVLLLLCSVPLFSIVFLFGGVDPGQFIEMYGVFFSTVLVLGAASLCISTLMRRMQGSLMVSSIFAFFLTLGLVLVTIFWQSLTDSTSYSSAWPISSYFDPLFAVLGLTGTIFGSTYTGTQTGPFGWPIAIWQLNIVCNVALAVIFLTLAIVRVRASRRT
jgi:ABC-2 type transport system permease protein